MKVILTNDDGIEADGLRSLYAALLSRGIEVVVVAPDRERSECGHSVTTNRSLKVTRHEVGFAIDGTPADCVRLALAELAANANLVIAGINHGGNLGPDTLVSGTVAAIREAGLRGIPAIAFSQYRRRDVQLEWRTSAEWACEVHRQIVSRESFEGTWNVNLPALTSSDLPPLIECCVDPNPIPATYEKGIDGYRFIGSYHDRPRNSGTDIDVCFGGSISVSKLT